VTPQEESLLNSLVDRVNQTQLQEKDLDAEALLNRALGHNPDALYILAQTVLVQKIALEQAQAQAAQLQQQNQQLQQRPQRARAVSFLGNLLGHHEPDPPAYAQAPAYYPPAQQVPPQPGYTPVPQYGPVQYGQPPQFAQPQYAPMGGGPPSFLRGAMQTAAGVAAGALAFEGVESVLHGMGGFGHPGVGMGWGGVGMGPGMGMMGGGLERPVEETVINNNYYDEPRDGQRGVEPRGEEEQHFHESADQGGGQFSDASYDTGGNDRAGLDQGSFDRGGQDDSSGFDDGGGSFDDGGGSGGDDGGNLL